MSALQLGSFDVHLLLALILAAQKGQVFPLALYGEEGQARLRDLQARLAALAGDRS